MPKMADFSEILKETFVHSKCKRSSLRSQCWMRHFLRTLNTVFLSDFEFGHQEPLHIFFRFLKAFAALIVERAFSSWHRWELRRRPRAEKEEPFWKMLVLRCQPHYPDKGLSFPSLYPTTTRVVGKHWVGGPFQVGVTANSLVERPLKRPLKPQNPSRHLSIYKFT